MKNPLVSLVVVTYNDLNHLKKVLNCIWQQDYPNIEIIIVDGGSKDGTIDFLHGLDQRNIRYISEKDNGIYDAINKGIKMATGEIIGCCYDYFASSNSLSKIVNKMIESNADAVHSDLNYIDCEARIIRKWRMPKGKISTGWMAAHPTLYINKKIYDKYGLYKTDYHISADYELMVRLFGVNNVSKTYIPEVLINMETGGTSTSSLKSYIEGAKEAYRALKENHIRFPLFATFCRTIRVLLQFI